MTFKDTELYTTLTFYWSHMSKGSIYHKIIKFIPWTALLIIGVIFALIVDILKITFNAK